MRLSLVSLLVLLTLTTPARASVRLLAENAREITIELQAENPVLTPVSREGKGMLALRLPEYDSEVGEGQPEIPFVRVPLLLPATGKVTVEATEEAASHFTLDKEIAYAETAGVHSELPRLARRDAGAYRITHGGRSVIIEELGFAGTDRVAILRLSPVRYDAVSGKLTVRHRLRIVVRHGGVLARHGSGFAEFAALNGKPTPFRSFQPRELVIAHESHRTALARYLDRKRALGREIVEHYVSGKTATEIRDLIRAEYQSASPPTSTLLVGNIDEIPAWRGASDNTWTDFDYTLLDSDKIPDLSLGRLPVHSAAELDAFIEKSFAREFEPRQPERILLTAGRDTAMGCPTNADRIGEKMKAASGLGFTKKYKTKVSTDEVISAYNANPNVVFYDGHGNRSGMTEIPLLMSTLGGLKNTVFPLILDIACLNANWRGGAKQRNFAESILLARGSGAAGILASGGSGNGHGFFQTIGQTMLKGFEDRKMNEVGQAILVAKLTANTQDRTYWNYYGDPTSSVWASSW